MDYSDVWLFTICIFFSLNCRHVIVLGDVNTSHKMIDHCDPDEKVINNLCSFRPDNEYYG